MVLKTLHRGSIFIIFDCKHKCLSVGIKYYVPDLIFDVIHYLDSSCDMGKMIKVLIKNLKMGINVEIKEIFTRFSI